MNWIRKWRVKRLLAYEADLRDRSLRATVRGSHTMAIRYILAAEDLQAKREKLEAKSR